MKKLSKEESENIVPIKRGRESRLSANMKQLKVGESLFIESKEVTNRNSMYKTMRNVASKLGWKIQSGFMPDGSGYIVERIS